VAGPGGELGNIGTRFRNASHRSKNHFFCHRAIALRPGKPGRSVCRGCQKWSNSRFCWKFQNSPRQLDLSWVRREAGEMTVRLHQHVLRRAYFSEGDKRTGLFGVVWAILVSIRREWVAAAQSGSAAPQAGGPGSKLVREARVEEFVQMYISCRAANFKGLVAGELQSWPKCSRHAPRAVAASPKRDVSTSSVAAHGVCLLLCRSSDADDEIFALPQQGG